MKKQNICYLLAGGILLLIFLSSGYWISRHNLSFTCSSSTASFATNANNTMMLNFTHNTTFSYSGKVVSHLSGDFIADGVRYVLNRNIVYAYTRLDSNNYSLRVVSTTRTGSDTVPVNLERTYLGSILDGAHRILGISEMPTGDILISNNAGPYLICAVH